jgi:hypothetical protein
MRLLPVQSNFRKGEAGGCPASNTQDRQERRKGGREGWREEEREEGKFLSESLLVNSPLGFISLS